MSVLKLPAAYMGFAGRGTSFGSTTITLNAAANRAALRWIVESASETLSTIKFYSTVTGSLGVNDAVCEIYAVGTDGKPTGAALDTSNTLSAAIATGVNTFTGFTLSLTAGTVYTAVFSNVNGTPASNYFTVRSQASDSFPIGIGGLDNAVGWGMMSSTDSGSTWAYSVRGGAGIILGLGGGTSLGWLGSNASASTPTVYSTRRAALKITPPSGVTWNVRGIILVMYKTGSPTGYPVGKIRLVSDDSVLGTTFTQNIYPTSGGHSVLLFQTPVTLTGGTAVRVCLEETTQSDASGNNYSTITMDALDTAVVPWSAALSTYDGASWTDDTAKLPQISLILDTPNLVTAEASGGGGGIMAFFRRFI